MNTNKNNTKNTQTRSRLISIITLLLLLLLLVYMQKEYFTVFADQSLVDHCVDSEAEAEAEAVTSPDSESVFASHQIAHHTAQDWAAQMETIADLRLQHGERYHGHGHDVSSVLVLHHDHDHDDHDDDHPLVKQTHLLRRRQHDEDASSRAAPRCDGSVTATEHAPSQSD